MYYKTFIKIIWKMLNNVYLNICFKVGRALGISILDLSGHNPWSRIPNSEFRSLSGIRDWLKSHCLSHQNFVHKNSRVPKQNRNAPNSQVRGSTVLFGDCHIKECCLS